MKEVIEKLDAIEAANNEKLESVVKEVAEQIVAQETKVDEKLAALEAKISTLATPSLIINPSRSVRQDCHKRVAEQMRNVGKDAKEIKLFESVDQYDAFMKEASALTGSGDGKGGRTAYDPVFVTMRQLNPLRNTARTVATDGSRYQFRVKTGNAGATWGYPVQNNGAATTVDSAAWDVILQDLNAQFPVRTAALDDIDGLESNIVSDMMAEFAQAEGGAMVQNDPGSAAGAGYQVGPNGPRGLDSYAPSATPTAGVTLQSVLSTTGNHNIATVGQGTFSTATVNNVSYKDLINVMYAIPVQYWSNNMSWQINPVMASTIRGLTDLQGAPIWDRMEGLAPEGYIARLLGFPVYINSYVDSPIGASGTVRNSLYFGDFQQFTIIDSLTMIMRRYDQTVPGSITFYGEKRTQSAVKDPFGLARLCSTV